MTSPAEFIRQVKQEGTKVTWPSRKETLMSGLMVLIVVIVFGGFFFGVDFIVSTAIKWLLELNY
jgi:preprotein translocase subunit SecE